MRPAGQKCGDCAHFQVRNMDEANLARIAKDESECQPGEWVFQGQRQVGCHGGAVRGLCAKWGKQVDSTFWCEAWQAGGPVLRRAGSGNFAEKAKGFTARLSEDGSLSAVGAVLALTLASMIKRRMR
jgi:hypothetical protein